MIGSIGALDLDVRITKNTGLIHAQYRSRRGAVEQYVRGKEPLNLAPASL